MPFKNNTLTVDAKLFLKIGSPILAGAQLEPAQAITLANALLEYAGQRHKSALRGPTTTVFCDCGTVTDQDRIDTFVRLNERRP